MSEWVPWLLFIGFCAICYMLGEIEKKLDKIGDRLYRIEHPPTRDSAFDPSGLGGED